MVFTSKALPQTRRNIETQCNEEFGKKEGFQERDIFLAQTQTQRNYERKLKGKSVKKTRRTSP